MLITLDDVAPRVDPTAYVQTSAQVIGDVHLGAESSVWFNAVLRESQRDALAIKDQLRPNQEVGFELWLTSAKLRSAAQWRQGSRSRSERRTIRTRTARPRTAPILPCGSASKPPG